MSMDSAAIIAVLRGGAEKFGETSKFEGFVANRNSGRDMPLPCRL